MGSDGMQREKTTTTTTKKNNILSWRTWSKEYKKSGGKQAGHCLMVAKVRTAGLNGGGGLVEWWNGWRKRICDVWVTVCGEIRHKRGRSVLVQIRWKSSATPSKVLAPEVSNSAGFWHHTQSSVPVLCLVFVLGEYLIKHGVFRTFCALCLILGTITKGTKNLVAPDYLLPYW